MCSCPTTSPKLCGRWRRYRDADSATNRVYPCLRRGFARPCGKRSLEPAGSRLLAAELLQPLLGVLDVDRDLRALLLRRRIGEPLLLALQLLAEMLELPTELRACGV